MGIHNISWGITCSLKISILYTFLSVTTYNNFGDDQPN